VDIDLPFEDLEAILAGNVFHRAVMLGPATGETSVDGITATVTKDGEPIGEVPAADVIRDVVGSPPEVIRYVADFLEPHGASLEPGHVIIAGSLTAPVPVEPGDSFQVDLRPLGALRLSLR